MSLHRSHTVRNKTMALPAGYRPPGSKAVRVSVSFDDDQFDLMRRYAKDHGVSFGQAVRRFIDSGCVLELGATTSQHEDEQV